MGIGLLPDETSPVLWLVLVAGEVASFVPFADITLRHWQTDSIFLALWFFGTIAVVLFFNWTVAPRVFLPAILPGALLLLRSLEGFSSRKLWIHYTQMTIVPTVLLALALAYSDQEWAAGGRAFAKSVVPTVRSEIRKSDRPEPKLLFMGHWGFQYYMERAGVRAADGRGEILCSGDLIFVAHNNTNIREICGLPAEYVTKQPIPTTFPIHAMNVWSKGGFYSSVFGPVPFNWSGKYPADRIILHRFTGKTDSR